MNWVFFAFNQKAPFIDKLSPFDDAFNNGPLYVSVFFERLRQYNNHLKKNDRVSPTLEQYTAYQNNKKVKATIEKAKTFHLYIDFDKLYADTNALTSVPDTEKLPRKAVSRFALGEDYAFPFAMMGTALSVLQKIEKEKFVVSQLESRNVVSFTHPSVGVSLHAGDSNFRWPSSQPFRSPKRKLN